MMEIFFVRFKLLLIEEYMFTLNGLNVFFRAKQKKPVTALKAVNSLRISIGYRIVCNAGGTTN